MEEDQDQGDQSRFSMSLEKATRPYTPFDPTGFRTEDILKKHEHKAQERQQASHFVEVDAPRQARHESANPRDPWHCQANGDGCIKRCFFHCPLINTRERAIPISKASTSDHQDCCRRQILDRW